MKKKEKKGIQKLIGISFRQGGFKIEGMKWNKAYELCYRK